MATATSRGGGIQVQTTDQGLPTAIKIEQTELRKSPDTLAREILRLCQQSARIEGLRRREELLAAGVDPDVIAAMGLPTSSDLIDEELVDEDEEYEITTWMHRA